MIDPAAERGQPAAAGRRRPRGRLRVLRRHRLHRARPTHDGAAADADGHAAGVVVRTYMAHHAGHDAGRAGERAARRSHGRSAFTPTRGCRPPSCCCRSGCRAHAPTIQPRPLDEMRVVAPPPPMPVRRYRSPHTVFPHAQFLSNGNYVTVVTNAGGGSSFCRGLAVTKSRRDPTRDPGSQFVYLRDVRSGVVWSATYHPTAARAGRLPGRVPRRPGDVPPPRRRGRHPARHRRVHRRRRRSPAADGASIRARGSAKSTSPATSRSSLAPPGRRSRASGVRQAVSRNGVPGRQLGAALPPAAARSRRAGALGGARA